MPPMSIMWADMHDPGDQLAVEEDRALHHHVLRVQPAAVVRVVGEEHVAGRDRVAVARDGRAHRVRRPRRSGTRSARRRRRGRRSASSSVHRVVLRLRDHRADRGVLDAPRPPRSPMASSRRAQHLEARSDRSSACARPSTSGSISITSVPWSSTRTCGARAGSRPSCRAVDEDRARKITCAGAQVGAVVHGDLVLAVGAACDPDRPVHRPSARARRHRLRRVVAFEIGLHGARPSRRRGG